ncbi:MAG TPA: glycerophosphodiester phosphodiesterase family protein [Puia sp.]|nr:glycerophosphodiester phosphodiesterase family protein [Puia sp.]
MHTFSSYRLPAMAACIFHFAAGALLPLAAGAQRPLAPLPPAKHPFIVVAHRGDHTQAPENTLAAYANAINAGADYVEIDLRTTADSQLVIMHDVSVDRMTNGHGLVKDLAYDSLRRLKVSNKQHPEWGEFDIPTFSQVLELCKDKIYIYLDFKNADPAVAYREISRYGMQRQVVVYINAPLQFSGWRNAAPAMPLMVSLPGNSRDTAAFNSFLDRYHPEILDGRSDEYTEEMVRTATARGYLVLPDIQGAGEGPAVWEPAIRKEIRGLQTDHPGDLIAWLKEKRLR